MRENDCIDHGIDEEPWACECFKRELATAKTTIEELRTKLKTAQECGRDLMIGTIDQPYDPGKYRRAFGME